MLGETPYERTARLISNRYDSGGQEDDRQQISQGRRNSKPVPFLHIALFLGMAGDTETQGPDSEVRSIRNPLPLVVEAEHPERGKSDPEC